MEGAPVFSVTDWIALGTLVTGAFVGLLTAWLTHRRPPDEEAEETYKAKPIVVTLHDEDRDLARGLKRGLDSLSEELGKHGRTVIGHGEQIADQTGALRKQARASGHAAEGDGACPSDTG